MFLIESLLLAFALCVDSFTVSAACALRSRMALRKGALMALVFALFQGGFPFLGALLGVACRSFMASIDHWVAFGLLLLVGGKMVVDAVRNEPKENQLDVSSPWVMCLLAIATSIDAFVVGITLGLENDVWHILAISAIVGAVTFAVSLFGVVLGRRNVAIPERVTTLVAGLVLIGLGVYTLIEHLTS